MKSFYIVLCVLVGVALCPKKTDLVDVSANYSGSYTFFVKGDVENLESVSVIQNGDEKIVVCEIDRADEIKKVIKGEIRGESFCTTGDKGLIDEIANLLTAKIVKKGYVGDIFCAYLYAPSLNSESLDLFNTKVNLQIAVSGDTVTVGCPINLGDY